MDLSELFLNPNILLGVNQSLIVCLPMELMIESGTGWHRMIVRSGQEKVLISCNRRCFLGFLFLSAVRLF